MASGSSHHEPRNQELNQHNILVDALAVMQKRMAEQNARIAEQINEIRNLR